MILRRCAIELSNVELESRPMSETKARAYDLAEAVGKFFVGKDGEWGYFLQAVEDE